MAVVQISKIQVRRGRKNSGSGLPQLSSGELGWAVDTQELYIGNGAVSEGAPAVGNTQILTSETDLFSIASQYSYKSNVGYIATSNTGNTNRSLQQKLDDFASAADFGMTGSSSQDVTVLLQNAIDQLYINPSSVGTEASRVTLHFPAGVYTVSNTIYIPPHASLVGEGIDKTIIKNTGSQAAVFQTVGSNSIPGSPADHSTATVVTQASNLMIKNLSLETTENNIIFQMDSCRDSLFEDVAFKGAWNSTDGILAASTGIQMNNLSASVQTKNNRFDRCSISSTSYAVYSDWDANNNTWNDCLFSDTGIGLGFGVGLSTLDASTASGRRTGAQYNKIYRCEFTDVHQQAIYFKFGSFNESEQNKFTFVGNNGGADYEAAYPVIQYDVASNISQYDQFSRSTVLGTDLVYSTYPYIAEIKGPVVHSNRHAHFVSNINRTNSVYVTKFRLPNDVSLNSQQFEIDYHLKSLNYSMTRAGTLRVTLEGNTTKLSDDYDFLGDSDKETDIVFKAIVTDVDADSSDETIEVQIKSDMPVDDQTQLSYTVKLIK